MSIDRFTESLFGPVAPHDEGGRNARGRRDVADSDRIGPAVAKQSQRLIADSRSRGSIIR